VIGVARTHTDAVALAKNKRPGLILADIQLADGSSGLDAVNELLRVFEVPVVFITAYPERFLTGDVGRDRGDAGRALFFCAKAMCCRRTLWLLPLQRKSGALQSAPDLF
jgi:DNA-binding LytR/AlgR family response regulator